MNNFYYWIKYMYFYNWHSLYVCVSEEEEEEEEDSEDECQELSLQSDVGAIGDESLEPPAKLARTDQRVLFTTGSMDNWELKTHTHAPTSTHSTW